jgi:cyclase
MEYDADVLVPGHGPPCRPDLIDTVGEYLRFVQDTAEKATAAGLTPLEAARQTDLGPYRSLTDSERIVGNLHRAYAECAGARPGDPIDITAAFVDMIAYNGGRPLRCRA